MIDGLVPAPGRQGPGRLPASALAALDLAVARRAGGVLPGEHRSPGVGAGTELAQLRPYEPGDDPRHLDPAASARTGVAHVRRHVPERALTTWIVLDASPSMAFGTGDRLKSDVAEGAGQAIGHVAVRRGGRVALITAGAADPRLVPPRGGRGAQAAVRRYVAAGVAPDGVAGVSLGDALGRVRRLAKVRGLVTVVSDFRDDGWERPLRTLATQHHVVAIEVVDPAEQELPKAGVLRLVDPESGVQIEADTTSEDLRRSYARAEADRREELSRTFRRWGVGHVTLSTRGDWLRELASKL